jgi:hypothetical protein
MNLGDEESMSSGAADVSKMTTKNKDKQYPYEMPKCLPE